MASVLPETLRLRQTISVWRLNFFTGYFPRQVICFLRTQAALRLKPGGRNENRMD